MDQFHSPPRQAAKSQAGTRVGNVAQNGLTLNHVHVSEDFVLSPNNVEALSDASEADTAGSATATVRECRAHVGGVGSVGSAGSAGLIHA
ncbi:hypothetical protein CSUB01_01141 [Colletotrichum sublineola]|uniref:Uncharacterized protein n=1 Tax=Colletotrichum sublineola TaxID=1173701 RepID=A0A066X002_COLSU|nr:hypothetical protein CSUB01_01141 [Colletotrichum sublineola]